MPNACTAPTGLTSRARGVFFFSSRRRHTRCSRDWSSDVCSSDLLKAISEKGVRSALFVCGMRVDEADGAKLLSTWDQAGHLICNHSYSHKLYGEQTSYADFAVDFLKNEKVIAPYRNRTTLFRYPFLKEGDTADKRDRFRALLKERGYRVGHV